MNIGSYILLIWSVSAISSVFFFYSEFRPYDDITLIPFIYLYALLMISFLPFLKFQHSKIESFGSNYTFIRIFAFFIIIVSIEPLIENLMQFFESISGNSSEYITDLYQAKINDFLKPEDVKLTSMGKKLNVINLWIKDLIPIFLMYFLTLNNKRNKFVIIGLSIALLNPILFAYINAGRVTIATQIIYIIFVFILFKPFINQTLIRKIIIYGGSLTAFMVFLVILITFYRFQTSVESNISYTLSDWISLYLGEGMLNFNDKMWNIKATMAGDNCFSFFKSIIGYDTIIDNLDRRSFWEPKTGISGMIFYTFIGDFFADMGLIGTIIFTTTVSLLIGIKTKAKKIMPLHKIFLLSIWFKICLLGFTFYTFKTYLVSQNLLVIIIIYFITAAAYKYSLKKSNSIV